MTAEISKFQLPAPVSAGLNPRRGVCSTSTGVGNPMPGEEVEMTMLRRLLKTFQIAVTAFRDNSIPGAQEQSQAEEEGLVQVEIEGPIRA